MESGEAGTVLWEEKCNNGISLVIVDRSRRLAGDRWLVGIECLLTVAAATVRRWLAENAQPVEEAPTDLDEDVCLMRFTRQRNFVDQDEWRLERDALVRQLREAISAYVQNPSMTHRLLVNKYVKGGEGPVRQAETNPYSHLDREEGPADFSSLFR